MTIFIMVAFLISWAILLIGPVVALASVRVGRLREGSYRKRVATICGGLVTLVLACIILHIETMWTFLNFFCLAAAYLAYCMLAALCWTLRPLAVRVASGLVAALPLVPGYVLGTVGIIALPFFLADYLGPAETTQTVRPGLLCRTTGWGAAFSDEGYIVHLYRVFPMAPIIRVEVKRQTVDETSPEQGVPPATCLSVASRLH